MPEKGQPARTHDRMTDEKSPQSGQPDRKTRATLEENGQLNLLDEADIPGCTDSADKNSRHHSETGNSRGLRRPRAGSATDTVKTRTQSPQSQAAPSSASQSDSDHSRPTGISDIDDVLDKDILFNFVNTPMLDDESLHATVQDVESSLLILADSESELSSTERTKTRPAPTTDTAQNDPLVLVKRKRNTGQPFAELIPAPLPVEVNKTDLIDAPGDRSKPDPIADRDVSVSQQAIEDVAHDAVQMMSRSIDAAGGNILNLELAREIRLNLTELLSEWQVEQITRGELKDPQRPDSNSSAHRSEPRNDLTENSNTYQFRPLPD